MRRIDQQGTRHTAIKVLLVVSAASSLSALAAILMSDNIQETGPTEQSRIYECTSTRGPAIRFDTGQEDTVMRYMDEISSSNLIRLNVMDQHSGIVVQLQREGPGPEGITYGEFYDQNGHTYVCDKI